MPEPAPVPEVLCVICRQLWDARDPGVMYRSLDGKWWCADERACIDWARRAEILRASQVTAPPETLAAMYRALDDSWNRLWERMGWDR